MRYLTQLRQHQALTQQALADKVGVLRPTLTRIESGERQASLSLFFRLVEALALTPAEALALGRELAGLPAQPAPPALDALPLTLDSQAVEVLELTQDAGGTWWAIVRPSSSPHATARRIPIAGLTLLPTPAVRAA